MGDMWNISDELNDMLLYMMEISILNVECIQLNIEWWKYNQKNCYNIIVINYAYYIGRILPYKPIVGSYGRYQHAIVLDLDLVQFYWNICCVDKLINVNASGCHLACCLIWTPKFVWCVIMCGYKNERQKEIGQHARERCSLYYLVSMLNIFGGRVCNLIVTTWTSPLKIHIDLSHAPNLLAIALGFPIHIHRSSNLKFTN